MVVIATFYLDVGGFLNTHNTKTRCYANIHLLGYMYVRQYVLICAIPANEQTDTTGKPIEEDIGGHTHANHHQQMSKGPYSSIRKIAGEASDFSLN